MVHRTRTLGALITATLLLAACGDDDAASDTSDAAEATTTSAAQDTTTAAVTTTTVAPASTTTATTDAATTVAETTTTVAEEAEPLAIWPAAHVILETPEEAAEDFVVSVLGEGPTLGEFRQGGARSGEMTLFSPGEGANPVAVERGVILLRQLGPSDGWFVVGVANDEASITVPESGATVPAGPLTVEGVGHGFEANLVARAFVAGDIDAELDEVITLAGTMEAPGPYSVELDLSAASPGDVIMIIVNTGAGLETDPGEVGAIPVVIAG